MVYGVWCMVYMDYGVWCMLYGVHVWCMVYMVYGVWCMVYGVWCMVYGVWCMVYGVWCMVYGCHSLVADHWWLKPEALDSISGGTTFLSFPLPFQRSSDSNGPDNLYRSSDLGEPHLSCSLCCDDAQILSKSQTHTAIIYYISTFSDVYYVQTDSKHCLAESL